MLCSVAHAWVGVSLLLLQVSLNGSAFNLDGSLAARVSAAGSNRAQLRNGLASFKSVRIQAREEGEYKLTVGSHSKKIAVQEASVIVKVTSCIQCRLATV